MLADRQRLRQVLLNLISNAIKYNRPQGSVRISWSTADRGLSIAVEDDGPGIPVEVRDRLFTPFDRLGAEGTGVEGTGIGLTVSRSLAELMNGTLSFESEDGCGATFTITLPKSDAPVRRWRSLLGGPPFAQYRRGERDAYCTSRITSRTSGSWSRCSGSGRSGT